jgi:hypothetical protein
MQPEEMMITKNDFDAALDAWVVEERERLGGPPAPEEVVAFLRGQLPPPEAERVKALLVYYPELTPLLDESLPADPRSIARPFAIAASVLIAILGVTYISLSREREQPAVYRSVHKLENLQARGLAPPPQIYDLPPDKEGYLLQFSLQDGGRASSYRFDFVDASSKRVWRTAGTDGTFVAVPRRFLRRGTYRIDVYRAASDKPIESFWIRTP